MNKIQNLDTLEDLSDSSREQIKEQKHCTSSGDGIHSTKSMDLPVTNNSDDSNSVKSSSSRAIEDITLRQQNDCGKNYSIYNSESFGDSPAKIASLKTNPPKIQVQGAKSVEQFDHPVKTERMVRKIKR